MADKETDQNLKTSKKEAAPKTDAKAATKAKAEQAKKIDPKDKEIAEEVGQRMA